MFNNNTHFQWKTISDLEPGDHKVRVMGRVVDVNENFLVIDDGTGTVIVNSNELINEETNNIILVLGTLHQKNDGEIIIEAEIIKQFDYLNFELYLKTYNIVKNKKT
ncbi:MAG: hypothetical protein ACTSQY_02500 [Candidatus Odinarchaeia archaeon]